MTKFLQNIIIIFFNLFKQKLIIFLLKLFVLKRNIIFQIQKENDKFYYRTKMINFIIEQKLELKLMKIVLQRIIFKKLIIFVEY